MQIARAFDAVVRSQRYPEHIVVEASLLANATVAARKINVDTAKSKVAPKDEMKSIAPWRRAESLARGVKGVQAERRRVTWIRPQRADAQPNVIQA
jgi:hypothetical protein